MKKTLFILSVVCFLGGVSCKKPSPSVPEQPDVPEQPTEQTQIPIKISTSLWTKATDTEFENGDRIGLYVVNYSGGLAPSLAASGNHVDNMGFTYEWLWTPDAPIYWKDQETRADFYCYHPYSDYVPDVENYSFAVREDQSHEADYKASDFLWGKALGISPTPDPVNITVNHVFSNILVYLKAGKGYEEEDLADAEVSICNVRTSSEINLCTGKAAATGDVSTIRPKKESDHYRALVVPQSVENENLVKIVLMGNTYLLSQTVEFVANKQHSCTITVNRTSEGLDIGIGGWETDDVDYGGSVE